jgi:hypothetical protein
VSAYHGSQGASNECIGLIDACEQSFAAVGDKNLAVPSPIPYKSFSQEHRFSYQNPDFCIDHIDLNHIGLYSDKSCKKKNLHSVVCGFKVLIDQYPSAVNWKWKG